MPELTRKNNSLDAFASQFPGKQGIQLYSLSADMVATARTKRLIATCPACPALAYLASCSVQQPFIQLKGRRVSEESRPGQKKHFAAND